MVLVNVGAKSIEANRRWIFRKSVRITNHIKIGYNIFQTKNVVMADFKHYLNANTNHW
jgi:hypothetical protein